MVRMGDAALQRCAPTSVDALAEVEHCDNGPLHISSLRSTADSPHFIRENLGVPKI